MKITIEVSIEDSEEKGLGEDEAVKATLDRLERDSQKVLDSLVAQIAVGEGDCE